MKRSALMGWAFALVLLMIAVYQQSVIQRAYFKAHVAEELIERSQDAIVNKEVSE